MTSPLMSYCAGNYTKYINVTYVLKCVFIPVLFVYLTTIKQCNYTLKETSSNLAVVSDRLQRSKTDVEELRVVSFINCSYLLHLFSRVCASRIDNGLGMASGIHKHGRTNAINNCN